MDKEGKRWWYDGEEVHFRSENGYKILSTLKERPYITYNELAQEVGIPYSSMQKMLDLMRKKGFVERRESEKCWYVLAYTSKLI